VAWGESGWGGTGAPSDNGYTKIYSNGGASNLPIKLLEQVKIAWLMLEIDCPAHQHEQKICSLAS
jgi:protein-L-isoaspartate O-methyltransferase